MKDCRILIGTSGDAIFGNKVIFREKSKKNILSLACRGRGEAEKKSDEKNNDFFIKIVSEDKAS